LIREFTNPFELGGRWFKGNIHAHSTFSDGSRSPEELVNIYKDAGYDFLSITDHSMVTDIKSIHEPDFLVLPGEEICIGKSQAGTFYHIVALGVDKTLPFDDFDEKLDPQEVINYINDEGGISILAHPYWSGLNHNDMMKIDRYHGVEIYNTSCDYERDTGLSSAHIDGLIVAGRRPQIYAVDDHHGSNRKGVPLDACGAWINVKAGALTREDIMDSIRNGFFYSSNGPELKNIAVDVEGVIHVECSPVKTISFVSTPSLGMRFYAEDSPLTYASYPGRVGETYVRIKISDYEGKIAWSNPIYSKKMI
jgi:hypothetical protein